MTNKHIELPALNQQIVMMAAAILGQPEGTADSRHPEWPTAVAQAERALAAQQRVPAEQAEPVSSRPDAYTFDGTSQEAHTINDMPAPQEAQAANAMNAALVEVAGCFDAAMCEGLLDALAETTDTRLKDLVERRLMYAHAVAAQAAAPVAQPATEQAEAPSDADPLTPEQEEWVMDLAEKHNLGRRVPQIGAMRGVAPDVFYTDASYRTHELFCFAAALLSTKELT